MYARQSLAHVLEGDRVVNTPYRLRFREDVALRALCTQDLWKEELDQLRAAIARDFYFQMTLDGLQVWGFLGKQERASGAAPHGPRTFLFTHLHFELLWNGSSVVQVDVSTGEGWGEQVGDARGGAGACASPAAEQSPPPPPPTMQIQRTRWT